MILLFIITLAVALETRVVSRTRIDLITDNYPHVMRVDVCKQSQCSREPIPDPQSRIIELTTSDWDEVKVHVTVEEPDGTFRPLELLRITPPKPIPRHYWYIITLVGMAIGLAGLYVLVVYLPEYKSGKELYQSPKQRDRELAERMGLYNEEEDE